MVVDTRGVSFTGSIFQKAGKSKEETDDGQKKIVDRFGDYGRKLFVVQSRAGQKAFYGCLEAQFRPVRRQI
jgi:hypothetical protein